MEPRNGSLTTALQKRKNSVRTGLMRKSHKSATGRASKKKNENKTVEVCYMKTGRVVKGYTVPALTTRTSYKPGAKERNTDSETQKKP